MGMGLKGRMAPDWPRERPSTGSTSPGHWRRSLEEGRAATCLFSVFRPSQARLPAVRTTCPPSGRSGSCGRVLATQMPTEVTHGTPGAGGFGVQACSPSRPRSLRPPHRLQEAPLGRQDTAPSAPLPAHVARGGRQGPGPGEPYAQTCAWAALPVGAGGRGVMSGATFSLTACDTPLRGAGSTRPLSPPRAGTLPADRTDTHGPSSRESAEAFK